ncbi:MAG: YcjF family protein [Clostridiales bacterium]|nr:YcjF family protein [Clostridiales bacterium]
MKKTNLDKSIVGVAEQAQAQQEIDSRNKAAAEAAGIAPKMTIYEYEQKYSKRENARGAKLFLTFTVTIIGVFLFVLLAMFTMKSYEFNQYVGYGVGAACLIVYIFVFIVPIFKLLHSGYFITNVNAYTASKAKRHNKKLRHDISKKIIDLTSKVEGVGWYDSETVGKLAIALQARDEEGVKENLSALYVGSVKRSARELILKASLKSAMYSALSQSSSLDTVMVALVNLQLIKDLVYLYGFRPSDAKLAKIFAAVIRNSLIAYGVSAAGSQVGNAVAKTIKGIPLLGSIIGVVVDSSVQGLTNGTLTTVIGYQTIKYMNAEYKLQNVLDGVEVAETQAEFIEACQNLENELKREQRATGKKVAAAS